MGGKNTIGILHLIYKKFVENWLKREPILLFASIAIALAVRKSILMEPLYTARVIFCLMTANLNFGRLAYSLRWMKISEFLTSHLKKKKIKYERKDPVVGKSKPQDLFVCFDVKEITVKIRRIYRNI